MTRTTEDTAFVDTHGNPINPETLRTGTGLNDSIDDDPDEDDDGLDGPAAVETAPTDDESDDARIQRLLSENDNDIRKVAKKLVHLQRLQGRQARELGEARQRSGRRMDPEELEDDEEEDDDDSLLPDEDEDSDSDASDDDDDLFDEPGNPAFTPNQERDAAGAPTRAAAPTAEVPDALAWDGEAEPTPETFHFEPADESVFYNESTDPVDPVSGWPLDADGDPYRPMNVYGVLYTPRSRWEAVARALSEKHPDNPAYAAEELRTLKEAEAQRVYQESQRNFAVRQQQQEAAALPYLEKIEQRIAKHYPEAIARGLAQFYKDTAREFIKENMGGIHPLRQISKSLLADVTRAAFTDALENDTLNADARKVYAMLKSGEMKLTDRPEKKATAPIGAVAKARARNSGVNPNGRPIVGRPAEAAPRRTAPRGNADNEFRDAERQLDDDPLVKSGFMTKKESQKYEGKTFVFED